MTTSSCPPEDDLVRMVEGALHDQSLAALEAHVDRCERCAAVIAGLGALDGAAARPRIVGRYQLDRRIGGGGMGEVWAAWDPQLRRDVAIKLVRPERADDDRERERLLREARALARLGHPNVLAVYDVGELDGGEVFIATELVAGDTLASRGGAAADWRGLARLYAQAARGLAAAHAAGLVHRDVKPANLLLGTDGRVRVADFGLAVRSHTPSPIAPTELAPPGSEPSVSVTRSGYIAGTPGYMAPEQRLGEPADARADQFALCVALTEAIAGRRPPLDVDAALLIAFVTERRPREPELDRLCAVLARGLAIDRADRFPDANALAVAIEATIEGAPTHTMPAAVRDRAAPPARAARTSPRRPARLRTLAIVAGAAALGITGVLIGARVRRSPSEEPTAAGAVPGRDGVVARATRETGPATSDPATGTASSPDRATGSTRGLEPSLDPALEPSPRPGAVPAPRTTIPGAIGTPAPTVGTPPRATTTPSAAAAAAGTLAVDDATRIELALAAARRALGRRDAKACLAALADLPPNVPVMTAHTIDVHRGPCEMLAGDCERGIARVDAALDGLGSPRTGDGFALQYCPVTGPFATRLARFTTQVNLLRGEVATCRAYLAAGAQLATDARGSSVTAIQKTNVAMALRQLARCISGADCDRAHALWATAGDLDQLDLTAELAPTCAAPPRRATAASTAGAQIAAVGTAVAAMQRAVLERDARSCRAQLKALPATIPAGYETSTLLVRGTCEMMLGDCATGQQHVAEAYGHNHPATVASMADIYCPIAGDLDSRLRRMAAQSGAFTGSGGSGIAWCDAIVQHARSAATEVQTDPQHRMLALVLRRVASCVSVVRRCDEARELWQLAVDHDASTPATPRLAAGCP